MWIRCEAASLVVHEAMIVPLDDAAMKLCMTSSLGAPKNDLQGTRPCKFLSCLPTNAGQYQALDDPAVKGGE
eukprot:2245668-Pyramimonas_sp.AAC.1